MSDENKPPSSIPQQLFRLPTPEELERSPNWQRIRQAYDKLERLRKRGLLSEFSSEMRERFRQMQPPGDSPPAELTRQLQEELRARREQAEEAEQPDVGKPTTTETA